MQPHTCKRHESHALEHGGLQMAAIDRLGQNKIQLAIASMAMVSIAIGLIESDFVANFFLCYLQIKVLTCDLTKSGQIC